MKNKKEDYGMDLKDIRAEIDEIDSQLVELLLRRTVQKRLQDIRQKTICQSSIMRENSRL